MLGLKFGQVRFMVRSGLGLRVTVRLGTGDS